MTVFDDRFNYGGVIVTRGEMLRLLAEAGLGQRGIDRYIQGIERSQGQRGLAPTHDESNHKEAA